jgi:hypothetical protein
VACLLKYGVFPKNNSKSVFTPSLIKLRSELDIWGTYLGPAAISGVILMVCSCPQTLGDLSPRG